MVGTTEIKPQALYDGAALQADIGLPAAAVRRARKSGKLRYTRQGKKLLYLGQWVLDFLAAESKTEVSA